MTPSCSFTLWCILIGFIMGAYAITHVDATVRDVDTLWAWTLRQVHGTPVCPKGMICSIKS